MSARFSFTVDRSKWYRGCGGGSSSLLGHDGKRCCVGFYCAALGSSDRSMRLRPYFPLGEAGDFMGVCQIPKGAEWLEHSRELADSQSGESVYYVNDDTSIDDAARELRLTAIFASHGIDVAFIDGQP